LLFEDPLTKLNFAICKIMFCPFLGRKIGIEKIVAFDWSVNFDED
jgi:hypothetical protein